VVIALWFYFCLWIESSGHLTPKQPHVYQYQKDGWMKLTRWYNLLAMLWMCQFVIGCQHMVLAGAISDWYFNRNKNALGTPILRSGYNLVRYHLGSVALGSFLIAVVQFARVVLKCAEKYLHSHRGKCVDCALKCCQCCLYCFEKILKYMSRNAYIEIAMYGYSFCQAGRQAFKLLVSNVLRVTAINSVGDFVLFLGKVLVVAATVLIGVKMLQVRFLTSVNTKIRFLVAAQRGTATHVGSLDSRRIVCILRLPLFHDGLRGKVLRQIVLVIYTDNSNIVDGHRHHISLLL
jgi:solute carrier family 44 protein 1 (choline transporter-like protein)